MGEKAVHKVIPFLLFLLVATPASSEVFKSKDGTGTYIGGLPSFYTSSAKIKGTPSIDKNGFYSDGTVKQMVKKDTWQMIKSAIDAHLTSSSKSNGKK